MTERKLRRKPRYMQPIRSATNLHEVKSHHQSKQNKQSRSHRGRSVSFRNQLSPTQSMIDLDEFDKMEQLNAEKFKLIQAKKIRDMIQRQYAKQVKAKQKEQRESQRIHQLKKQKEMIRKQKSEERAHKIEEEKARRESELRKQELEALEKNKERDAILNEKMEAVRLKKLEQRRKLEERARRENEKRKQMELERARKFEEIERQKFKQRMKRQEKALLRQQQIAELKEREMAQHQAEMQRKREQQRAKILKMRKNIELEIEAKKTKSLKQMQTAEKRRKEMDLATKIAMNQRRIEMEEKRLKVMEKKHFLMQNEIDHKRENVEQKDRMIRCRIAELSKMNREKSSKIHQDIGQKQKRAMDKMKEVQREEEEYVHSLQHKLKAKYQKTHQFKQQKHELYKKAMEKKMKYHRRKEKFSNIVNELLRTSNSVERLQRLGINIDDPDNIDLKELAEILEGGAGTTTISASEFGSPIHAAERRRKILAERKKCIIKSQHNLQNNRTKSVASFTLPSQKPVSDPIMDRTLRIRGENEYCLAPTPAFPVTQTRKILFSMAM